MQSPPNDREFPRARAHPLANDRLYDCRSGESRSTASIYARTQTLTAFALAPSDGIILACAPS